MAFHSQVLHPLACFGVSLATCGKLPCSLSHSPCPLGHALGPGAARYNQLSLAINSRGQVCCSETSLVRADYIGCSGELCPWHHCTGSLFIARRVVSWLYQASPPGAARRARAFAQAVAVPMILGAKHVKPCLLTASNQLPAATCEPTMCRWVFPQPEDNDLDAGEAAATADNQSWSRSGSAQRSECIVDRIAPRSAQEVTWGIPPFPRCPLGHDRRRCPIWSAECGFSSHKQ